MPIQSVANNLEQYNYVSSAEGLHFSALVFIFSMTFTTWHIYFFPESTTRECMSLDSYCMVLQVNKYHKIHKHFQNVTLVGMASEISKNYTYKCVDRSRHNGIKSAKAKCAH